MVQFCFILSNCHGHCRGNPDLFGNDDPLLGHVQQLYVGAYMNHNHRSQTVLSPLFTQNLAQRLEQLNNVDQFTDSSNLALPSRCFSSSRPIRQLLYSISLRLCWEGAPSLATAAQRPPLPTPAGRRPRNAPSQIERRAVRGFVSCKA